MSHAIPVDPAHPSPATPEPSTPPTLPLPRTEEICLRLPDAGDVDRISEICQDPDIQTWTTVPSPYARADAERWVARCRTQWEYGNALELVAVDVPTDRVVATVSVTAWQGDRHIVDIGYLVAPEARGRGLAPLLVGLVRDWIVHAWPVERVQIQVRDGNERSERIAEKCGFVREGVLRRFGAQRGVFRDLVMFSWLPGESTHEG